MTQIKCPYCQTSYEVDLSQIGDKIKKLRCAKCKEVFSYQKDLEKEDEAIVQMVEPVVEPIAETELQDDSPTTVIEPETPSLENVTQINEIFERLNQTSQKIVEEEQKHPSTKKKHFAEVIGWSNKTTRKKYYFLLFVLVLLSMNYFRFEITRLLPFMEYAYKIVGIDSVVPGEGLEFANVERNIFEEDAINKMEIKGYIVNTTKHRIKVPHISVALLNRDAYALQTELNSPPATRLEPEDRISFRMVLSKPSALGKYVYLTFTKKP